MLAFLAVRPVARLRWASLALLRGLPAAVVLTGHDPVFRGTPAEAADRVLAAGCAPLTGNLLPAIVAL